MNRLMPQIALKNLKAKMNLLKAEGKEVTVDNLNAQFLKELKKKLKEEDNE